MKRLLSLAIALLGAAITGCGERPYDVVEVSGQVLLDGQPLPGAHVLFRPTEKSSAGPEAFGKTDADGKYSLTTIFDDDGATVGRNVVSITTLQVQEDPSDPDNGGARNVLNPERVPSHYNHKSEIFFDVRAGGSQTANFYLQTR
jgi:hypothetical protein